MHIEFKRVILHNFMSFSDADLKFNDDGFVRVTGQNHCTLDNADSNGSGKSSLWEAIIWAISGETIRGTKQIVNIYGDDGCFVDLEFYIDQTRYQLIRSKDHKVRKTNLQILINGEDVSGKGIRDSEKLLQQYLPDLTASLLGSVIVLGQGMPQKFTNNTPSGRKEVLEKLSKSDFMIEDLKTRVTERKSELSKELRGYEDHITESQGKISVLQSQIDRDRKSLSELNGDDLEHDLKATEIDRQDVLSKVDALKITIQELEEKISSNNEQLFNINNDTTKQLDSLKDCALSVTIQQCSDDINRLKSQKYALESELRTKLSIKDVCPTCGQKLPDVVKPDVSGTQNELNDVTCKLDCANEEFTKLTAQYNSLVDQIKSGSERVKSQISEALYSDKAELQTVKSALSMKENRLRTLDAQYADINNRLSYIDSSIQNLNNNILHNRGEIASAEELILYNNKQKDLTQSRLDVVSKFDTALKRDFRGYLLSTVINFIETRAKQYSSVIFDTDEVDFCLDGNNIDIRYRNKAYENLSGGEKQKIDLIIQFSIRDMLAAQLGFTSNLLVLDEIFDNLDLLGCNRVIDMITNLPDVKNIFIVTHRQDLSLPGDRDLVVVKSDAGISEILK